MIYLPSIPLRMCEISTTPLWKALRLYIYYIKQYKWHVIPLLPHVCPKYRWHRCESHFEYKVISSVGRIVKPTHMACRSSRIYVNIGANNSSINNKNNNSSNNSRMHEIWATPIRKILWITIYRSSHVISILEQITTISTIFYFNSSDGQKHGKSKVFQGWLLEKQAFTDKFDDFRGFVGLHQFRRLHLIERVGVYVLSVYNNYIERIFRG